jgi:hypothetical protein
MKDSNRTYLEERNDELKSCDICGKKRAQDSKGHFVSVFCQEHYLAMVKRNKELTQIPITMPVPEKYGQMSLEKRNRIIEALKHRGDETYRIIAARFKISPPTLCKIKIQAEKKGLLKVA